MLWSTKELAEKKVLTYGMVGGGQGAFIGDVHRKAAALDGHTQIVAGCFSRDYENTKATGAGLGISPERLYENYDLMAEAEAERDDGIDFAVIVTPNKDHYPAAKAFLSRGIHIICDKPVTCEVEEAEELRDIAEKNGLLLGVTYAYSGYPMMREARRMILNGEIGEVHQVMGEYPQGWLLGLMDENSEDLNIWKNNPEIVGASNCTGDIGTHIENSVAFMTGLKVSEVCAKLDSLGKGAVLDTNSTAMVKFDNGATGVFWASQMAAGHDNGLKIRVFGSKGAVTFVQEDPNYLRIDWPDGRGEIRRRGHDYLSDVAKKYTRIPSGHPEGYYEAFANIYVDFTEALFALKEGTPIDKITVNFPTIDAGIAGVKFIHACVDSSRDGSVWVKL